MFNKKACVYKIEAPSGNFYIGSTIQQKIRFMQHKHDLKLGIHVNAALQFSANKYGIENLKFEVIMCVLDKAHVRDLEQQMIDELKPAYNISKNAYSALFDESVIQKRIATLSKPVVRLTDGAWFCSGYEAARAMGGEKQRDQLPTALKLGWRWLGHFWKYAEENKTLEQVEAAWNQRDALRVDRAKKAASKAKSKAVICVDTGEIFKSCTEAQRAKGIHLGGVSRAALEGSLAGGLFWKFADDPTPAEEIKGRYAKKLETKSIGQKQRMSARLIKKVKCKETGEIFSSVKEATKAKGLGKDAIRISFLKNKPTKGLTWEYLNA